MIRRWQCPSCDRQLQTDDNLQQPRLHPCRKLAGLLAPFVEVTGLELNARQVRHRVIDREDYVGNEIAHVDANGRPVMALATDRADGSNDLVVYPGTATATAQ